jgi:hypothetical protein
MPPLARPCPPHAMPASVTAAILPAPHAMCRDIRPHDSRVHRHRRSIHGRKSILLPPSYAPPSLSSPPSSVPDSFPSSSPSHPSPICLPLPSLRRCPRARCQPPSCAPSPRRHPQPRSPSRDGIWKQQGHHCRRPRPPTCSPPDRRRNRGHDVVPQCLPKVGRRLPLLASIAGIGLLPVLLSFTSLANMHAPILAMPRRATDKITPPPARDG